MSIFNYIKNEFYAGESKDEGNILHQEKSTRWFRLLVQIDNSKCQFYLFCLLSNYEVRDAAGADISVRLLLRKSSYFHVFLAMSFSFPTLACVKSQHVRDIKMPGSPSWEGPREGR